MELENNRKGFVQFEQEDGTRTYASVLGLVQRVASHAQQLISTRTAPRDPSLDNLVEKVLGALKDRDS